jgi:hypothetical protein
MIKLSKNKLIVLGVFSVIIGLAGAFVVENMFPYMGIKPWRMEPAKNAWRFPNGYTPEDFGLTCQKLQIKTPDGLLLRAFLVQSNLDTTYGVMVQLHGISNCKETNFPRARILADSGYASLLLDLRAHGESEGEFCTFGYYEKNDLKAVADTLALRLPGTPMGIWGASLGGAIALQAMAADSRYQFGIVESTFDEYPKVVAEYGADYMLGLRPEWLLHRVMYKSGIIAHFDPYAVMPVKAAATIQHPVLFMHGDKDARIPMEFNRRNFDAVQSAEKQWVTVSGGGHSNLWSVGGPHLSQVVHAFLAERRKKE